MQAYTVAYYCQHVQGSDHDVQVGCLQRTERAARRGYKRSKPGSYAHTGGDVIRTQEHLCIVHTLQLVSSDGVASEGSCC